MAKAKEDHSERVAKAAAINADIAKTFDAVVEANNVLQVHKRSKIILLIDQINLKQTIN